MQRERDKLTEREVFEGCLEYMQIQAKTEDSKHLLNLIKIFYDFHKEQEIDFDFLVIYTKQFINGFRKQEFGNIELRFPELKKPCCFGEVSNVLKGSASKAEKFFFLYYVSANKKKT